MVAGEMWPGRGKYIVQGDDYDGPVGGFLQLDISVTLNCINQSNVVNVCGYTTICNDCSDNISMNNTLLCYLTNTNCVIISLVNNVDRIIPVSSGWMLCVSLPRVVLDKSQLIRT